LLMAQYGNGNPHLPDVASAERIAKHHAERWDGLS
jgi:response regulator RpfG family c-di-GMP phosphodiesterase